MIIQCPACGARATLPDSKEGAKVRCSECSRVYVARSRAAKSTRSQGSMLPIGIGAGAVALALILFAATRGGGKPAPAPPPPKVEVAEAAPNDDLSGWNSELVRFTRGLHDAAYAKREAELQNQVAFDRAWAHANAVDGVDADPAGYVDLGPAEKLQFDADLLAGLVSDAADNLVGQWTPFDGGVLEETDSEALIRLTLQSRDAADGTTRHIDWRLTRTKYGWKAFAWDRWLSPEELAAARRSTSPSKAKTTLSDGSVVYEAEVEKVEWPPETTAEQRAHYEKLISTLIDLEARREWIQAQDELKAIGKPVIPGLLNRFAELDAAGWEDIDRGAQGQRLHQTLMEITGYVTTFNPHEALGGTDERRESGVKQWFYWYNKKFKRFEAKPEETDLLEELWEPKTEAEKREYEKQKKLIEQEKKEKGG